jgi:hypothetical protein
MHARSQNCESLSFAEVTVLRPSQIPLSACHISLLAPCVRMTRPPELVHRLSEHALLRQTARALELAYSHAMIPMHAVSPLSGRVLPSMHAPDHRAIRCASVRAHAPHRTHTSIFHSPCLPILFALAHLSLFGPRPPRLSIIHFATRYVPLLVPRCANVVLSQARARLSEQALLR